MHDFLAESGGKHAGFCQGRIASRRRFAGCLDDGSARAILSRGDVFVDALELRGPRVDGVDPAATGGRLPPFADAQYS